MKVRVKKIAYSGMFIATSIILTRFASQMLYLQGLPTLRISFGEIPLMLSGIILGPFYGAACGALADLLGFPLNPQGTYFPGFTLTAALAGFLPGLLGKFIIKNWNWKTLTATVALTIFLTSIVLNTIWLQIMTGKTAAALLPARVIASVIMIPIHVAAINLILKHFKYINKDI